MEIELIIRFVLIFAASSVVSCVLFWGVMHYFPKWGLLDNPAPYGHDRKPVPHGVGVVLYLNFLICSIAFLGMSEKLAILLVLGAIVTLVSFLDDLDTIYKYSEKDKSTKTGEMIKPRETPFAISPKIRLALQILIGLIVGLTSIKISYVSNIFGGIVHLDWLSFTAFGLEVYVVPLLFTIVWYVVVFNSVNWSDGVPGLTSGLTSIAFIVIGILTVRFYYLDQTPELHQNSIFVFSILAVCLPAALIGWFLGMRPRILLGDSGTMFASFIIASLALLVGGKVATVATALGVYLIDAFYVIFARILSGKNPLKGDRIHHLHYRLLAIGMSEGSIRAFVWSLSFLFGMAAAFLDKVGKIILFVALVLVIVFVTKILSLKK